LPTRASGRVAGIQAGADLWRQSDNAGLYFASTNGNAGVTGRVSNAAATT